MFHITVIDILCHSCYKLLALALCVTLVILDMINWILYVLCFWLLPRETKPIVEINILNSKFNLCMFLMSLQMAFQSVEI